MDQVTQQNAAMVEEATAAASSLRSEAAELETLVARFETGGKTGGRSTAAPVAADARPRLVAFSRPAANAG
jgi:methyl-accepting chemotaxis protein